MANLVECRNLRLGYGAHLLAPCPDFTVGAGDFLGIVGPNGAGKTTLLKVMAGLLEPLSGTVALAAGLRHGGIGYLPQQSPLQKDFPASVREVVLSGCQTTRGLRPFYTRTERWLADRAMVRFGVAPLARRCYRELSGGQRQRVLLARAIAAPHSLLLLDEPTSGLDPQAATELYRGLADIAKDGIAIAMVTHDLPPVERLATHILRLGPDASFERNPRHD